MICLMVTLGTLESQAHMTRFLMSCKATFLSCLVVTHGTYEQISDELEGEEIPKLSCTVHASKNDAQCKHCHRKKCKGDKGYD